MKHAHIVSHVHWDREWRYPIWQTRIWLVKFMDELIEILEQGLYKGLVLDGQYIPIEDYLEYRPENAGRLKKLVEAGNLDIGPWYTLPDEYPIDGECLIRNLLTGLRKSRAFGKAFEVGYTSFGWGQTAQLPQIYNGFGISVGMVGKRVSSERAPQSEFLWKSPDGSTLLVTRFGHLGRQNFFLGLHLSMLFGVDHLGAGWEYDKSKVGVFFHHADPLHFEQDCFRLDVPNTWHPDFVTEQGLEKLWNTMQESRLDDDHLMMNGCDYSALQKLLPEMIEKINQVDHSSGRHWRQSTMSEYIALMQSKLDVKDLVVIEGELRDGPAGDTSGNALATHMDIKHLNQQAQNLLVRFAEPLSSVMALDCRPLIDKAWLLLMQSHPHDSINGVTQDTTVQDVKDRLRQVIGLAKAVADEGLKTLVKRVDCSGFEHQDDVLIVYNPLPYARREVVEAIVLAKAPAGKYEFWPSVEKGLIVYDANGGAMATQWQGAEKSLYPVSMLHSRAFPYDCICHRVFFDTGVIPAGGYSTYCVRPLGREQLPSEWKSSMAQTSSICVDERTLENEFLKISFNPNGTFDLLQKVTGQYFNGLNYYQDRGEAGDFWINQPPAHDRVLSSLGCNAKIWTQDAGPLQATIVSEVMMEIPSRLIRSEQRRSQDVSTITLRAYVTLKAGSEQVEVRLTLDNPCQDHCLRVMFPTDIAEVTHADAGGHFIVDHRPIRPQGPDCRSWWPNMGTLPTNQFVDLSNGTSGVAFLHRSFTEYEVSQDSRRTVALTLLKSVQTWICTESRVGSSFPSQKAGQCLGHHEYHYAIRPHTGNWQDADIPTRADMFNTPVALAQTNVHSGCLPGKSHSLFSVSNSHIRFSTLKWAEEGKGTIVRLYNPTSTMQKAVVQLGETVSEVWETDLNEKRMQTIKTKGINGFSVSIAPYKIVTYEVQR